MGLWHCAIYELRSNGVYLEAFFLVASLLLIPNLEFSKGGISVIKKILLFSYISSVLLFSGFARAEEQTLDIQKINYEKGSWVIEVHGLLPNLCVGWPEAALEISPDAPQTFILKMVATAPQDLCGQAVRGPYKVTVDLRRLIAQSKFKIEPGVTYTIKAENYPFELSFEGPLRIHSPSGAVEISGVLVPVHSGGLALLTDTHKLVLVDGGVIDYRPFLNTHVFIVGRFGPLPWSDIQSMQPSHNQLSGFGQRLTIVEISAAVR